MITPLLAFATAALSAMSDEADEAEADPVRVVVYLRYYAVSDIQNARSLLDRALQVYSAGPIQIYQDKPDAFTAMVEAMIQDLADRSAADEIIDRAHRIWEAVRFRNHNEVSDLLEDNRTPYPDEEASVVAMGGQQLSFSDLISGDLSKLNPSYKFLNMLGEADWAAICRIENSDSEYPLYSTVFSPSSSGLLTKIESVREAFPLGFEVVDVFVGAVVTR